MVYSLNLDSPEFNVLTFAAHMYPLHFFWTGDVAQRSANIELHAMTLQSSRSPKIRAAPTATSA